MIQQKPNFTIEADGNNDSAFFNIKAGNLAHLFDILRSNLYSDKILAVIREYSTNAMDANIQLALKEGREPEPILVTIPTSFEPIFQVRDFGSGLSKQEMFEVYASYGESTKRESNEFNGTLGMGSKSGFAYAPSFTITSWNNGKKSVYEAFIDETKIGTIMLLHEEESNEPSGIAVTIAVNSADIATFVRKAEEFYRWFKPMPKFVGNDISKNINSTQSQSSIIHESDLCTFFTVNTYGNSQATNLFVRMGNVCYPVNNKQLFDVEWLKSRYQLVIEVGMGEVSFTTSRESLEMTDFTINTIKTYLEKIVKELSGKWQSDINSRKTAWDAICFYNQMDGLAKSMLLNTFEYKGKRLNVQFLDEIEVCDYSTYSNRWEKNYAVPYGYGSDVVFLINDGGFPASQLRDRLKEARLTSLAKNASSKIVYLRGTVAASNAIVNSEEIVGANIVKLSSIDNFQRTRKKNTFKKSENLFRWNDSRSFPYSGCWDVIANEPTGTKVYVKIEKAFKSEYSWDMLKRIKNAFSALGEPIEVYGIKGDTNGLDKSYIHLKDFISKKVEKLVSDKTFIDKFSSQRLWDKINSHSFYRSIRNEMNINNASKYQCPLVKNILSMKNLSSDNTYLNQLEMINLTSYFGCSVNNKMEDLKKLADKNWDSVNNNLEECAKKYPLFAKVSSGYMYPKDAEELVRYVNLVHKYGSLV